MGESSFRRVSFRLCVIFLLQATLFETFVNGYPSTAGHLGQNTHKHPHVQQRDATAVCRPRNISYVYSQERYKRTLGGAADDFQH
jgi:hypothetical protein